MLARAQRLHERSFDCCAISTDTGVTSPAGRPYEARQKMFVVSGRLNLNHPLGCANPGRSTSDFVERFTRFESAAEVR